MLVSQISQHDIGHYSRRFLEVLLCTQTSQGPSCNRLTEHLWLKCLTTEPGGETPTLIVAQNAN